MVISRRASARSVCTRSPRGSRTAQGTASHLRVVSWYCANERGCSLYEVRVDSINSDVQHGLGESIDRSYGRRSARTPCLTVYKPLTGNSHPFTAIHPTGLNPSWNACPSMFESYELDPMLSDGEASQPRAPSGLGSPAEQTPAVAERCITVRTTYISSEYNI